MTQARPIVTTEELRLHQNLRRGFVAVAGARRELARGGLIYTRRGVLDMTRRHKLEEVVIDRFGQRVGGATW